MGERRGDDDRGGNPLVSGRGVTTMKNVVVQRIAGLAAQEVDGIRMGGGAARAASRASGGRAGTQEQTRGVSVDVGRTEVAIDLTLAVDYGRDVLRTVNRVRDRVSARVEPLTGLKITELNVTVSDVVLPEDNGESGGNGSEDEGDRTRQMPRSELRPGARERGYTEVDPRERTHTESQSGPVPDEPVRAKDEPVQEDQTAELRLDKDETGRRQAPEEGGRGRRRDRRRET